MPKSVSQALAARIESDGLPARIAEELTLSRIGRGPLRQPPVLACLHPMLRVPVRAQPATRYLGLVKELRLVSWRDARTEPISSRLQDPVVLRRYARNSV